MKNLLKELQELRLHIVNNYEHSDQVEDICQKIMAIEDKYEIKSDVTLSFSDPIE